jgi:hypothetical protein
MNLKDIFSFQFKRVNPFPGLAIDVDTWRDAHNYSRDQQRMHNLIYHQPGMVEGLQVTENDPPDFSVNIHPGVAMDSQGNMLIVRNVYHYHIQCREKKTIFLIIQFREVLDGPYQPPEGGQPTRVLDGYRIQERDSLPEEPYLELARLDLDPSINIIKNPASKQKPGQNEINSEFRLEVPSSADREKISEAALIPLKLHKPKRQIIIGYLTGDDVKGDLHLHGLRNLAREVEMRYSWAIELEENVPLDKSIEKFDMIYLTGGDNFKLNDKQLAALKVFINSRGILLAEDCEKETTVSSPEKIGPVYDELMAKLKLKLKPLVNDNPLLSNINVFSEIPQGMKSGVFLNGESVIYTNNDYGCAWQGGHKGNPLSREAIRTAFEIGLNIVDYAYRKKTAIGS